MVRIGKRWFWLLAVFLGFAGVFFVKRKFTRQHVSILFLGYTNSLGDKGKAPRAIWLVTNSGPSFVMGIDISSQAEDEKSSNSEEMFFWSGSSVGSMDWGDLHSGRARVFAISQPEGTVKRWRIRYFYEEHTLKVRMADYVNFHHETFPFSLFPVMDSSVLESVANGPWLDKVAEK
jgi:hypothetical protein